MGDEGMSAMPQQNNSFSTSMLRRIMAGIEALILAGIIYLVNSDQQRKEDMIILKTTSTITAQAVANIPDLTIRMTKIESDMTEAKRRIALNEVGIENLKNKERLH